MGTAAGAQQAVDAANVDPAHVEPWDRTVYHVVTVFAPMLVEFVFTFLIVFALVYGLALVLSFVMRACTAEHWQRLVRYGGKFTAVVLGAWSAFWVVGLNFVHILFVTGFFSWLFGAGLADTIANAAAAVCIQRAGNVELGKAVRVPTSEGIIEGVVVGADLGAVTLDRRPLTDLLGNRAAGSAAAAVVVDDKNAPSLMAERVIVPNTVFVRQGFIVPAHTREQVMRTKRHLQNASSSSTLRQRPRAATDSDNDGVPVPLAAGARRGGAPPLSLLARAFAAVTAPSPAAAQHGGGDVEWGGPSAHLHRVNGRRMTDAVAEYEFRRALEENRRARGSGGGGDAETGTWFEPPTAPASATTRASDSDKDEHDA